MHILATPDDTFFALLSPIHLLVYGQLLRTSPLPLKKTGFVQLVYTPAVLQADGSVDGDCNSDGRSQAAVLFTFSPWMVRVRCCFLSVAICTYIPWRFFPSLAYPTLLSLVPIISYNHTVNFKSIITAELNQPIWGALVSTEPLRERTTPLPSASTPGE